MARTSAIMLSLAAMSFEILMPIMAVPHAAHVSRATGFDAID